MLLLNIVRARYAQELRDEPISIALYLALRLGELDHFVILFYKRQQRRRVSNRKIRKKLIGFRRENKPKSEADQGSVQCTGKQLQVRIQILRLRRYFKLRKPRQKNRR